MQYTSTSALAVAALVVSVLTGCAQQAALTTGSPLNGPAPVAGMAKEAVAGWQGRAAEATDAEVLDALRRGPRSRAARMLAAVALERVTRRSIDPARLAEQ